MAWPDDRGRRGLPARDAGVLEDKEAEWAVAALFIQRLNSLRGEAEKCQREEDDYERYRSSFLPRIQNTPPPPVLPLPEACADRHCERGDGKREG